MSESKPVEQRKRQQNWQVRQTQEGLCRECPEPREPKPGGGHYLFCHVHRMAHNERMKLKMRARRDAGLAPRAWAVS